MLAFAAARIGLQSGSLDSRNRTYLIIVRRIARNADGADRGACGIADQHATRIGNHTPAACGCEAGEKHRRLFGTLEQSSGTEAHAERAPGFAERDIEPQNAGLVLALESHQMPAGIQQSDGQRRKILLAALFQSGVENGSGLRKRQHDVPHFFWRRDQYTAWPEPSPCPKPAWLASSKQASVLSIN